MIKDPGELSEQVSILELQSNNAIYIWAEKAPIWAKVEMQSGKNLFSTVGLGAKSVKFTVWKQNITLNNAFMWQGKHCFLTDINGIDRMYYEITAALIEPKTCTVKRLPKEELDSLNRPIKCPPQIIMTFPGCLTEKYMGFIQQVPQSQKEAKFVLVTPKKIRLKFADLVEIEGTTYTVQISHELDEFKNEYEIYAKKDG